MYELIILSRLMRQPSHGYLIAKIINDIIGPYARISNGRLYPLLAKLEQTGLIMVSTDYVHGAQGERHTRVYHITSAGEKRFYELMHDTSSNPGDYQQIFAMKACALTFLPPGERLRIIDHYIQYCQNHILHLSGEMEDLQKRCQDGSLQDEEHTYDAILDVIYHLVRQWELELAWAQELYAKHRP